jgi:hypothetical protein
MNDGGKNEVRMMTVMINYTQHLLSIVAQP